MVKLTFLSGFLPIQLVLCYLDPSFFLFLKRVKRLIIVAAKASHFNANDRRHSHSISGDLGELSFLRLSGKPRADP